MSLSDDPSPSNRMLVVALGDQKYRVDRPFLPYVGPGAVTDVAADASGMVHVLIRVDPLVDPPSPAVISLREDGSIAARWGGEAILDAHMLHATSDGRVLIVDRDAHEVVIFRHQERIGGIGRRHFPLCPFNHPTDVAVCPAGTIYVSDGYANHLIHRFAEDGTTLAAWGAFGSQPGEFINPHAVWVQPDGRVIVADRENDRLQFFDPEGRLLDIVTGFVKPLDIWGDSEGRLYVTDMVPSLTLLDTNGVRMGRCRPVLNAAHGVSGDANGNIYLAEPAPSRVSRLVPLLN